MGRQGHAHNTILGLGRRALRTALRRTFDSQHPFSFRRPLTCIHCSVSWLSSRWCWLCAFIGLAQSNPPRPSPRRKNTFTRTEEPRPLTPLVHVSHQISSHHPPGRTHALPKHRHRRRGHIWVRFGQASASPSLPCPGINGEDSLGSHRRPCIPHSAWTKRPNAYSLPPAAPSTHPALVYLHIPTDACEVYD